MSTQPVEIMTPVGRIVAGNPLEIRAVTDQKTGQPKLGNDGQPRQETYFGLAIAKQGEANWWDTEWGAQIAAVAARDWTNGETQMPTFAWKIVDGDSAIPNQAGRKPCEQEGYAGHWVLNCATGIPVRCYREGQFEAHQVLQPAAKEIKTGDYGRALLSVRGNMAQPPAKPGIYLNPQLFSLVQPGPLIVTSTGPDPAAAFSQPPSMPAGALPDPTGGAPANVPPPGPVPPGATPAPSAAPPTPAGGVPPVATPPAAAGGAGGDTTPPAPVVQTPPAAVTPAPDFLNPDQRRLDPNGNAFTVAQLKSAGWTDEQIKAAPVAP